MSTLSPPHFDSASRTLFVISGAGDDKAYLHKVTDTNTSSTLLSHVHKDSVSCAAFNMQYVTENLVNTPIYAAVGAFDGAIVIYDPLTGTKLQELEGPSDVEFLSFHTQGGFCTFSRIWRRRNSLDVSLAYQKMPSSFCRT
jgi:WD40 repeat protein